MPRLRTSAVLAMSTIVLCASLPLRAAGDHCTVVDISVVAGPWENTASDTSYAVQTQDGAGESCHVGETLRLEFSSSGAGTFTSQSGSAAQAWISTNSANRNFYYHNPAATADTITVRAGYGSADDWEVLFEATHNTHEAASNPEEEVEEEAEESETDETPSTTSGGGGSSGSSASDNGVARVSLSPDDPLSLRIAHASRAYVSQPVQFTAVPSGLGASELRTIRYRWNFGDGTTSTERTPQHTYTHAGTYVVVAVATRAGHEAAARTTLTVLPLTLSLAQNASGDLLVHNDAKYESDLSGVVLGDGVSTFSIPEHTYLAPHATLTFSPLRTGFSSALSYATAHDQYGVLLAEYSAPPEEAQQLVVAGEQPAPLLEASAAVSGGSASTAGTSTLVSEPPPAPVVQGSVSDGQPAAAGAASDGAPVSGRTATMLFVGMLGLGVLALYAHRLL